MKLSCPFVLASGSPRRKELLERLKFNFSVFPADIDEMLLAEKTAAENAESLAIQKVQCVAEQHPQSLTLAADTLVILDGTILGKPENETEAIHMLTCLSGHTHEVITGVALAFPPENRLVAFHETTRVTFAELSIEEIRAYVAGGSPMDKAGSYGIQDDHGAFFVRGIDGDYYNVVGLPLHRLYVTLKAHFADLLDSIP